MAIWMGEEPHWRVYGEMLHSVKTGKAAWEKVRGMEAFPYLFRENQALGKIFDRVMAKPMPGNLLSVSSDVETLSCLKGKTAIDLLPPVVLSPGGMLLYKLSAEKCAGLARTCSPCFSRN